MKQEDLIQLIRNTWKFVTFNEWEYLFEKWDTDFWLFYIDSWTVVLESDWMPLIELWGWEVIWEKAFIDKESKPLSAKVIENDTKVFMYSQMDFLKLPENEKKQFYERLSLFLANRVYKMNTVMSLISEINDSIVKSVNDINKESLKYFVADFLDLEWFLILKYYYWEYQVLYWDMIFDQTIEIFINWNIENKVNIRVWTNYIYIFAWDYIFLFYGNVKLQKYVLSNALYYSRLMFRYMWEKIEEKKDKLAFEFYNYS